MTIFKNRFITFFILLFIKLKCQLIITSNDIESERKRIASIFRNIFLEKTRTLLYQKQLNFKKDFVPDHQYQITKVKIINFCVVDNDYVPYFINEKNVLVYFPHKIKFVLNVEYFSNVTNKTYNENFGVFPYNCIIKNYDTNKKFSTSFSAVFDDEPKTIIDENKKNDTVFNNIVDSLKFDFWFDNEKEIKETIKKSIISGINDYYQKKESIDFNTINNDTYSIFLNNFTYLCNISNLNNTYQCYYMGNLNNYPEQYLDNVTLENKEFYENDGKYKIFFHNKLIKNIINQTLIKTFNYRLNDTVLTKFLKNQIKKEIEDKNNTNLEFIILDAVTKNEKNQLITNFKLINRIPNIGNKETINDINITFNVKINLTGFNFCYDSTNLKIIIDESKNDLFNLNKKQDLNDELYQLLKHNISNEENCLFQNEGIDLIEFMKLIEKCEIIKEGLMCVGEYMMNEK